MEFLLYHTKIYGRHFAPKKNKIFSNKEAVIPNKAANEVLLIPKFIWHHLYRYSRFEWSSFWSRRRIFNPFGAFCFRIPFNISVCVCVNMNEILIQGERVPMNPESRVNALNHSIHILSVIAISIGKFNCTFIEDPHLTCTLTCISG